MQDIEQKNLTVCVGAVGPSSSPLLLPTPPYEPLDEAPMGSSRIVIKFARSFIPIVLPLHISYASVSVNGRGSVDRSGR